MRHLVAVVLASTASLAAASPSGQDSAPGMTPPGQGVAETQAAGVPIAVAVNTPFRWLQAESVAGSLYVGFAARHAVRLNAASYPYGGGISTALYSETYFAGRVNDAGIGWQYSSRGLADGFTFAADVLVRRRDARVENDAAASAPETVETDSTTVGGRVMVGTSMRLGRHVFVALSIGLSVGHERGTETTTDYAGEEPMSTSISRLDVSAEGFARVGVAFGR